jgi:hypothetical protein
MSSRDFDLEDYTAEGFRPRPVRWPEGELEQLRESRLWIAQELRATRETFGAENAAQGQRIRELEDERDCAQGQIAAMRTVLTSMYDAAYDCDAWMECSCSEGHRCSKHRLQTAMGLANRALSDTKSPFILSEYVRKQREWSTRTFGPGRRTEGLIEHITKEFEEIRQDPADPREWIDIVILALDGAWRAGWIPEQIEAGLVDKQAINLARKWPKATSEDRCVEHVKESPEGA